MKNKFKTKYRAKELAEYLGIGLSTVWKWTKDKKIKSYVISAYIGATGQWCRSCTGHFCNEIF